MQRGAPPPTQDQAHAPLPLPHLSPSASAVLSLRRRKPTSAQFLRLPLCSCIARSFCLHFPFSFSAWRLSLHSHNSDVTEATASEAYPEALRWLGALPFGVLELLHRVSLCFLATPSLPVCEDPPHPLLDRELYDPVASSCERYSPTKSPSGTGEYPRAKGNYPLGPNGLGISFVQATS